MVLLNVSYPRLLLNTKSVSLLNFVDHESGKGPENDCNRQGRVLVNVLLIFTSLLNSFSFPEHIVFLSRWRLGTTKQRALETRFSSPRFWNFWSSSSRQVWKMFLYVRVQQKGKLLIKFYLQFILVALPFKNES